MKTTLLALLALSSIALAGDVNIAWDPNPETDITKYTVKWGTEPGVYTDTLDVVPETIDVAGEKMVKATLDLAPGATYHIAVTATNSAQLESLPSGELEYSLLRPSQVSLPVVIKLNADGTWEVVK